MYKNIIKFYTEQMYYHEANKKYKQFSLDFVKNKNKKPGCLVKF